MPVHINQIIEDTKPLHQKIQDLLAADPNQFYSEGDLLAMLVGEVRSYTAEFTRLGAAWGLLGFAADLAKAREIAKLSEQLQWALAWLVWHRRIEVVDHNGIQRFGVTVAALPGWLAGWLARQALPVAPDGGSAERGSVRTR